MKYNKNSKNLEIIKYITLKEFPNIHGYDHIKMYDILYKDENIGDIEVNIKNQYINDIFIKKSFRKMGIGSYVYDLIEKIYSIKLKPSKSLSKQGKEFWNKRKIRNNPGQRKILFLDHDGVMIIDESGLFHWWCVEVLNQILLETKCDIVVSSDWKLHYSLNQLKKIYINSGIIKRPIDVTPNFKTDEYYRKFKTNSKNILEKIRSDEIVEWLRRNKDINKWVAIDDMKLRLKNFVLTNEKNNGLAGKDIKQKVLEYLL